MKTTKTYTALFGLILVIGCRPSQVSAPNNTPAKSPSEARADCVADFQKMPKPFGLRLRMSIDEFAKLCPEIGVELRNYRKTDKYGNGHFRFNDQGNRYTGVYKKNYGIKDLRHIEAFFRGHELKQYLIYYVQPDDYTKTSQEMINYLQKIGAILEPKQYGHRLECKNIVIELQGDAIQVTDSEWHRPS